jgi:hypothetical protein
LASFVSCKKDSHAKEKGLLLGTATGIFLTVSVGNAGAAHIRPYTGAFAVTFLTTRIDRNDDGLAASWNTAEVKGTFGKRTIQGVTETVPTGATTECSGGVLIIDAASGIGFGRGTSTLPGGDQIYTQIVTRHQCNLGQGRFEGDDTVEIVGGAGRFAGASGASKSEGRLARRPYSRFAVII